MNIAFPAIVIALLLLPGAIFRYSYARGSWGWSSPTSFRSVSDELAYGAIFAAILHLVGLVVASAFGYFADFPALVALLLGNFGPNSVQYDRAIAAVADRPLPIATYHLALVTAAALLGWVAHHFVRKYKFDLKTPFFRFRNEWHYLLTGEALYFSETSATEREIDGVFLSAVVDHGKDSYLYRGIVDGWSFDRDGQLDTIRLRMAHRRLLSADRPAEEESPQPGRHVPPDERYYEIRGDLFIVRYSQIKTLNLDYFFLEEEQFDAANGSRQVT